MRLGQMSEFMGVVFLAVIIVMVLLLSRLSHDRSRLTKTEVSLKATYNRYVTSVVAKFPFVTEKGVTLGQLMGTYVCYRNDTVSYGPVIGEIVIGKAVARHIDSMMEPNKWRISIDGACIDSAGLMPNACPEETGEYVKFEFVFPLPCSTGVGGGWISIMR